MSSTTVPVPAAELEAKIAAVPALQPGTELGDRYRIERLIARGGMGAVYEAFDRELGVRVALKTVRPDIPWGRAAIDRFKREIQLARVVTHPGVCRTFDLGRHDQLVFLTMELLAGVTLAERLTAGPLPGSERLSIVEQLAAALDAAHAAGVLHRDLKPANIMLCPQRDETRVVITDFGVAHDAADGDAAGTPAYMAPEQRLGVSSPAADIYALGVVMYELATGALPVDRDKLAALSPDWSRAITRCLADDPADRFASAGAVVAALKPRRVSFALLGVFAVGAAAGVIAFAGSRSTPPDDCAIRSGEAWGPAQRAAIARALPAAEATRVDAVIDRHVARWNELDRQLCIDRAAGHLAADQLTARERCLDRRLIEIRVLGRQVSSIDAASAARITRLADALPRLELCVDAPALAAPIDPALDEELVEIGMLVDLTQYAAAVKLAETVDKRLSGSTDDARRAQASFLLARARIELGDLAGAEAPLREATRLAARQRDDAMLARCWVSLTRLLTQLGRMREALTVADVAEAAVVRAGNEARLAFQLQMNLAFAEGWEDRYHKAIERSRAAIAAAEQAFGEGDADVLSARLTLAEMEVEIGDPKTGEADAILARDRAEKYFGSDDFRVAIGRYTVGLARRDLGDYAAARPALERALADAQMLGEHHPGRFHAQAELGRLYLLQGDHVKATAAFQAALALARGMKSDGVRLGLALGYLGDAALARGDAKQAERWWTEALAMRREARGDDHLSVGRAHAALGLLAIRRGDRARALEHLEAAVARLAASEVTAYGAIARARLARVLWERPETRARAAELAKLAHPALRTSPGDVVFDLAALQRFVGEACEACR